MTLLLLAFGAHIWCDLGPLALSNSTSAELPSAWLTWGRFAALGFAAVVVPVSVPRLYVSPNPNVSSFAPKSSPSSCFVKGSDAPNPEQTAPLISLVFYQFLDPLVWAAYRARKLQYDQLPPLADYDRAAHLKQRSFDQLDPFRLTKQRHLFWGLMYVFRREYYVMAAMITIKSFMDFTGPIGIRYLLK
ncbi:hypothetical protein FRC10_000042 [Ceratobasidium sp. 414]|nr:hypothetical protein FRC10_000042 [Ceratobasidium sp. 414]